MYIFLLLKPIHRRGIILLVWSGKERRFHFICNLREVASFNWVNFGGGWLSIVYLFTCMFKNMLAGAFYGPSSTWRAERLDQVILLV